MRSRAAAALIQPVAVIAAVLTSFAVLIGPFRRFETAFAADLLHLLGVAPGAVQVRPDSALAVYPDGTGPFLAVVTPSCSSLSSVLAITFLAVFTPRRLRQRRFIALGIAVACVVAGNIVRIAGSIAIGLVAGTNSLVLFHDWVGSLFAFAYTLGGYLLMLFLLLSAKPDPAGSQRAEGVETGIHVA